MLRGMGIPVKSHMSTVDESLRHDIKKKFEQERAEIKKEYERKKQMLTKAREDLIGKEEEPKEEAAFESVPAASVQQSTSPAAQQAPVSEQQARKETATPQTSTERSSVPRILGGSHHVNAPIYLSPVPRKAADTFPPKTEDAKGGKKTKAKEIQKKNERPEVDELELKANIRKTLAKIGSGFTKKKYKKETVQKEEDTSERKILNVAEFVTVSELANMMNLPVSEVLTKCLELGLFVTINQRLDFETIELLVDEFGYSARLMTEYAPEGG